MTPERLKLVENFIMKEEPEELTFQEMQAIVNMLYDIYIYTVTVSQTSITGTTRVTQPLLRIIW